MSKLKGRYSANTILILNSWLKNVDMCIQERKLSNMEALKLMKELLETKLRDATEFYSDTHSMLHCRPYSTPKEVL